MVPMFCFGKKLRHATEATPSINYYCFLCWSSFSVVNGKTAIRNSGKLSGELDGGAGLLSLDLQCRYLTYKTVSIELLNRITRLDYSTDLCTQFFQPCRICSLLNSDLMLLDSPKPYGNQHLYSGEHGLLT